MGEERSSFVRRTKEDEEVRWTSSSDERTPPTAAGRLAAVSLFGRATNGWQAGGAMAYEAKRTLISLG